MRSRAVDARTKRIRVARAREADRVPIELAMTRMGRCLFGCCLASFVVAGHLLAQAGQGEPRQVEVDGHSMHLAISGEGTTTVVLEAGSGFSLDEWRDVQPAIAAFTRVV